MPVEITLRRYTSSAAILASVLGAATLLGWIIGFEPLRRLFLEGRAMSLNSALCFTFYGVALLLVANPGSTRAIRSGRILSVLILLFAVASWIELSVGINLGINQLFFPNDLATRAPIRGPFPINTIVPLVLVGVGLLAISQPRQTWLSLSSWLGLAVMGIALLGLTSQLLAVAGLVKLAGPALTSTVALAALGSGLACTRIHHEFFRIVVTDHPLRRIVWRLLLLSILAPLLLYLAQVWLILDKAPELQEEVILVTALFGTGLLGSLDYFLRRLNQVDAQRADAESARDVLFARVQQQAANLQLEVANRIQELNILHERMRFAVGSAGFGVWEFDFSTKRLLWDDRTLQVYGVRRADFHEQVEDWRRLVHPDDLPAAIESSAAVYAGRATHYEAKFRINRPDGAVRYIHAIGYLQTEPGRGAARLVGLDKDVTHEHESEHELAELNERLQLALRAEGGGVWDYDRATARVSWDARQCEIYGISPADFDQRHETWRRFIHPDDLSGIEQYDIQPGSTGDYLENSFRIIRADGAVRHIRTVGYIHRDAAGQPVRIVGLDRDITDDVEMRDKLRVTEERLALALQASGEGMWDWDVPTGQVYFSPRWMEMLGYSPDELPHTYATWERLIHPEDFGAALNALQEHFQGRTAVFHSEHRLRTKDGGWIWSLSRGVVVRRDAQNHPLRIVGMQGDITARKLLEQQLRRNQESALQVGRLAQIGAWEVDVATRKVTWDPEVYRIHEVELGYQPAFDETVQFFSPEARAPLKDALSRAEWDGSPFDLELPFVTARNRRLRVRVIGRAELRHGRAVRLFGAFQDITSRFEIEQARHQLETQLFQAQKMETLGTLAGGIAHDFNNLLTGIMGYQDLALDTLTPEHPSHHCIAAAREASFRARGLVDQILTFSRPAGDTEPMTLDLTQVLEEARRFLRATLPSTIDIQLELTPGCGRVQADATQMHQVLLNLGSNAAHAMRSGGGTLRLALTPVTLGATEAAALGNLKPGPHVQLAISDNGHGIDPETLKRIFDPFFTTKSVGEGTGLGLSVVHGIIRAHHGAIQVQSALGEGTRFDIYLAVSEEDAATPLPAGPVIRGLGEIVCIVDDEELVGRFTKSALERSGYTAIFHESAAHCLKSLQENPAGCAVLLTDQTMPSMTGMELSAQVRAFAPKLPIIVMSGYFSKISPAALDQIGHISLLAKPFNMEEVAAAVHRALHPEG